MKFSKSAQIDCSLLSGNSSDAVNITDKEDNLSE